MLETSGFFVDEFKSYDLNEFPLAYNNLGSINNPIEMAEVYNLADIYLSTSPNESFSYTVLEAVFCGVYTIGFNTGEIGPILKASGNGELINNYTLEEYINAVQTFFQREIPDVKQMNLMKYTSEKVAQSVMKSYSEELNMNY